MSKVSGTSVYGPLKHCRFWGHTQKDGKQGLRDICTPMFTTALFTVAERRKQPQCPRRMDG